MPTVTIKLVLSASGGDGNALADSKALIETPGARIVVRQDCATAEWIVSEQDQTSLRSYLSQVWQGAITPSDAHRLGETLGRAFISLPAAALESAVELHSNQAWLLTDIPWEFAHYRESATIGPGLPLGHRALLRVPAARIDAPLGTRPTVLIAVAHLTGQLNIPIHPEQYLPALTNELRSTPPFQVASELGTDTLHPLYVDRLLEAARAIDPDVVVLVAHGKANPPTIYFENEATVGPGTKPVPVSNLARELGTSRLLILLCCDVTRATGGPSGALSFIGGGVPEVVTMQGEIPQNLAAAFVKRALIALHRQGGVAEAVRSGRDAISSSLHQFTPVGFSSLGAQASADRWRSARNAYNTALRALPPTHVPALPRPRLGESIERWLAVPGCRIIRAPYDPTGRAVAAPFSEHLLAQASASVVAPRRPTVILDFGMPADHGAVLMSPWDLLFDRLVARLSLAFTVLPRGTVPGARAKDQTATEAADQLIDLLNDTGIALVVVLAHTCGESADFWQEVARVGSARLLKGVLLIAPRPDSMHSFDCLFAGERAIIPPLSAVEINGLFRVELTAVGMTADTLLMKTGGNPFLLHVTREATHGGTGIPIDQLAAIQAHAMADAAAAAFLTDVDSTMLPSVLGLCFVQEPASGDALAELFPDAALGLLTRLWSFGILGSVREWDPSILDGPNFFYSVNDLAEALRARIEKADPEALSHLAESLSQRLPDLAAAHVLIARPGGLAALAAAQRVLDCYSEDNESALAHAERAFELGLWASQAELGAGQLSRHLILHMLQTSRRIYETHSDPSPDLLIAIAAAAHSIGEENRADEALEAMRGLENIPLELQIKREWLTADRLKDLEQRRGLDCALDHLARARRLLVKAGTEIAASDQHAILNDILYTTMKIFLFLQDCAVDDLPLVVREMVDRPAFPLEQAVVHCTFAEQEMRRDHPDWDRVQGWLNQAEPLVLDPAGLAGLRAYCAYQIAQDMRKRPKPDLRGAVEYYKLTESLAHHGGDLARQGLAVCRRAQILASEKDEDDPGELAILDLAIAQVIRELTAAGTAESLRNAFRARALVRLHRMRAQVAPNADEMVQHHRAAALAGIAPALTSKGDRRLLADSCQQFLAATLPMRGTYLLVRRFIVEMEGTLQERLGLAVDRDKPEALLAGLQQWQTS